MAAGRKRGLHGKVRAGAGQITPAPIQYSTKTRFRCVVVRNFNLGEDKWGAFYTIRGLFRGFQGKTGWGILGERARVALDRV